MAFSDIFKNNIFFRKAEDGLMVPSQVYNFRIFIIAATASFAAVVIGYDAGFIGGTVALTSFADEFDFASKTPAQVILLKANVVSVFQAGAFFGSLLMFPVGELFGRKIGLIISGFFLTFGGCLTFISKHSTGLGGIYASRVITGLGVGGCSGLAPIYVAESAPVAIRGVLVGLWEICWQVGGIAAYWINYGLIEHHKPNRSQWLIPFAVQLVPCGLFWAGSVLIPESPRWLLANGKKEKARKNLAYIRNLSEDDEYISYELGIFQKDITIREHEIGVGFFAPIKKILTSKKILIRLLMSTSMFIMQNGSGINAVTYYSPTVFQSFGISGSNAGLLSTGIFGIIKAVASIFWLIFVVDNYGRRWALFWGSFPCAFCMYYIGAYVKIANPAARLARGETKLDNGGKAAQAMLYIWTFFYGSSWNGTPWCYNSEIFDQHIRTVVQAINASSNWFWAFIMGRFTGNMFEKMGYGVYFLFAGMMTVSPWVVYFFYPESKGVPLEAIDHLFEVPAWRAREHALQKYREEYMNAPPADLDDDEKANAAYSEVHSSVTN